MVNDITTSNALTSSGPMDGVTSIPQPRHDSSNDSIVDSVAVSHDAFHMMQHKQITFRKAKQK
jgi:hypothetical protein